MKFLEGIFDNKPIMPLNIYYNKGTSYMPDDVLDIIYKDMETGKKYVQTITNPDIEIWICKKEFRSEFDYIKNFLTKDKCYPVTVKYKDRFKELAKILNTSQEKAQQSPYVFGGDVRIEHFYMMQFIVEYGNILPKKLSCGYLDIETDIISIDRFPEPGEVPINAVTFIDDERRQCYTLLLKKDDIPSIPEGNPKYTKYQHLRNSFYEQINTFEDNIDGFIDELHQAFDDSYGEFNYNILLFDNEIELLVTLFKIINASDNDYIGIWNAPFDVQNLMSRPRQLGYSPESFIVNEAFGPNKRLFFKEDKNAMVHKRKHTCLSYTMPTFVDQMVIYAGIRSGRGKLPSTKLNAIAKTELGDTKLDYTEEGQIRYLPYMNYKKFVMYNIKDVLLQVGINRKTNDLDNMYTTIYTDAVLPNEIFTSTTVITNSLRMFVDKLGVGYVMGYNKNKFTFDEPTNQPSFNTYYKTYNDDDDDEVIDDIDDEDEDDEEIDDTIDDNTSAEETNSKKKDKFKGAFVMSPSHMLSTGFKLLGAYAKFIHQFVIDMDIGAELHWPFIQ